MERGLRVRGASLLLAMCGSSNRWLYHLRDFCVCVCVTLMLGKDKIILFKIFKGPGFLCW